MNRLKKAVTILPFCIVFALANHPQARAAGFIFHWQPFAVDENLKWDAGTKFLPDERPILPPQRAFSFDQEKQSFDYEKNEEKASGKTEKKSVWDNVKIVFSPAADDQDQQRNFNFVEEEKQASRFLNSLHTLIYHDEKIHSLQEIIKGVEPEIKFYLEF
jgi:hypothetical protein